MSNTLSRQVVTWFMALLFIFIAGCSDHDDKHNYSDMKNINKQQSTYHLHPEWPTYIVGGEANYPPFALRDKHGHIIGFDIDLLNAIGHEEQFNIKFIPTEWADDIFNRLDENSRDIIASGANTTPERLQKWAATEPLLVSRDVFIVKADSGIHSIDNLSGKVIATELGSPQEAYLRKFYTYRAKKITGYPSIYLAFESLLRGQSDAVYFDEAMLDFYIRSMPDHFYQGTFKSIPISQEKPTEYVFFIKKSNTELLKKLNDGLRKIKNNGEYAEIQEKWFGTGE